MIFPQVFLSFDAGESCGTGQFVLHPDQELTQGFEFPGFVHESPVGESGVPSELAFESGPQESKAMIHPSHETVSGTESNPRQRRLGISHTPPW
jgi:hypothetical protein